MAAQTDANEIDESLEIIRSNHDESFLYISQGLSYEEQKQPDLAYDMYERGLEKIDKALNVRCDRPHCVGPQWDNARKMQQKMRKTVQMIRSQMQQIALTKHTSSNMPQEPFEPPPSYSEACKHELVSMPRRSSCPGYVSKREGSPGLCSSSSMSEFNAVAEVIERFSIPEGVQLFFVSPDGGVSTSGCMTSLYIYQFVDNGCSSDGVSRPPAWLQIENWTYPLVPGKSPSFESGYGAFLFPDVGSETPGSSVGIILPAGLSNTTRAAFESLLAELTAFEDERRLVPVSYSGGAVPKSESFSESLSRGIVIGAEFLSAGLVKGASLTSNLIHKGACKVIERLHPEEKPVVVDSRVRDGLKLVRDASGVALKASGFLVKKLGDLTVSLGKQLAPHVRNQGGKVLCSAFKEDPDRAKRTMDDVLTVAAGGLAGFSTVYMGLETAAKTLASSLSEETVKIVDHKYGEQAGEVVGNAVYSVGNLALTTHNVQSLGVKAVAKRTAKDTGKAVLDDYVKRVKDPEK